MEKVLKVGKLLTKVGGNIVFDFEDKIFSPQFLSYSENIDGLSNNNKIIREFSWSDNKIDWSPYKNLSNSSLTSLNWSDGIFIKFRYEAYEKYDESDIVINDITLSLIDLPIENTTKPFERDIISDFPNLSANFFDSVNQMNEFLSQAYGLQINYLLVEPDLETNDVILAEFSLQHVADQKCIHIVITDNNIPNNKFDFFEFGMDYENFEVYILKSEFKRVFGEDKYPRVDDILFLPQVNKLYYMASVKIDNTVDNAESSYVCYLKDYVDNTSIKKSEKVKEFLDTKTVTYQELFGEDMERQIEDLGNIKQNSGKTIADDVVREFVNLGMKIKTEQITNNGTAFISSYYDLCDITYTENALVYKKPFDIDESFAYTCLFQIPYHKKDTSYNLQARVISENRIDHYTTNVTIDADLGLVENGSVMINSQYFDIKNLSADRMSFDISSLVQTHINNPCKKVVKSIFLQTSGIIFNLYDFKFARIQLGNNYYQFALDSILVEKQWYGLVVNISNAHSFVGTYIWKQTNRTATDERFSTRMEMIEKREYPLQSKFLVENEKAIIKGSKLILTNLRFVNKSIPLEYQSIFLQTKTVRTPSMCYIIDDSEAIWNIPTIGDGHTLQTEIENKNNKTKRFE